MLSSLSYRSPFRPDGGTWRIGLSVTAWRFACPSRNCVSVKEKLMAEAAAEYTGTTAIEAIQKSRCYDCGRNVQTCVE